MPVEVQGFREVGYGPFPIQVSMAVDAMFGILCIGAVWGGRLMARSLRGRNRITGRFNAMAGPTAC
jgi:hypothetical protein